MKIIKTCFVLSMLLFVVQLMAQSTSYKYRINLKDKGCSKYTLDNPQAFLSAKAIERRQRQGIAIDSADLPVSQAYVEVIEQNGGNVVTKGKWNNFVTVAVTDTLVAGQIAELPFVKSVELVWVQPIDKAVEQQRDSISNNPTINKTMYGEGEDQIKMCNGIKLHEAGFKGTGISIAVIDAGFHNMDKIRTLQNVKVKGIKDMIDATSDIYAENNHGLGVISCMAMNEPTIMIGTAPDADYWLLRSEDANSEQPVEQDYWAAAVEYADSVGIDVINASLGYYLFDNPLDNFHYHQLDGQTTLMSRQGSMVAEKGMVLVCSAGNTGTGSWKKITPPGDSENVLTVGAVDKNQLLAPFSSVGNTADGRVKPDVVAMGLHTRIMGTQGVIQSANGTSFASPIVCGLVACLWQALPQLTAKELIELVRLSGDRAQYPNNIYGYGIPDFWKAYQLKK